MKRVITILMILLMLLTLPASAEDGLLADSAGLLSQSEQQALSAELSALSGAHGMQVAVATVPSTEGADIWDYANDYYDQNLSGDGVLLLIAIRERQWALIADGTGYQAVNDDAQITIEERILPLLQEDRFYDAFSLYASLCEEMILLYEAGEPYEIAFPVWLGLLIALGIGLLVALIAVGIMKGQLKSVRAQRSAAGYVKAGSMQLTRQTDLYLYSQITRIPRPKSSSSSGGGGGSRGGRSGSF